MTWQTVTTSSNSTETLAAKLAANLRGGETIELVSDLGGGKTTFTRGLVHGAGVKGRVASPTFTISSQYDAPKFTIYHFDFYRLAEAGIVANELDETVRNQQAVTIVEWGDIVHDVLPKDRLTLRLQMTGENERQLTFEYPENLAYLLKGIK